MKFIVRPAAAEDFVSLVTLNQVVQGLHVEAEPAWFKADPNTDEVEAFFGKLIAAEKTFALIAGGAGKPLGYIWFELQDRPATPFTNVRRRIYIHHVVVSPDSRRAGVGSSLLRAAEVEAQGRGFAQVALDTWAFNEEAQDFFQAAGFETFNVVMRKELGAAVSSTR